MLLHQLIEFFLWRSLSPPFPFDQKTEKVLLHASGNVGALVRLRWRLRRKCACEQQYQCQESRIHRSRPSIVHRLNAPSFESGLDKPPTDWPAQEHDPVTVSSSQ